MIRFSLLTLLCLWGFCCYANAANCHMRELDLCAATIMISATDGVPGDEEDLDRICEPVLEGFDCVGNYSKTCFTPVMQEIYDIIMAEPLESQKKMCTPGSEERAQYLKNAPCFQKVMNPNDMKPHMEDLLAAMEKATESHFNKRVPIMCCGIQRLMETMINMVRKECGEDVLEEGSSMLGISITTASDMFCRSYKTGSAQCDGVLPPSGSPYKGVDSDNQLIRFMASAIANFS